MSDFSIPKKELGQHWLHDTAALTAMADGINAQPGDAVLEIGPGMGTLTEVLLERGASVTAVEFDHDLAIKLPGRVPSDDLTVIEQDILSLDFRQLSAGYKVSANIPYYLTSNLLRVMCESPNPFSSAALLMQKEVAERVVAQPGSMSMLSVSVQYYCEASLGMIVPAELFTPPPKVDSQILLLTFRAQPLFSDVDTKQFFRIVKAGFSQRRKKLRSSLSAGLQFEKTKIDNLLTAASIDGNLRAQNLSLSDWHAIYTAYLNLTS